MKSKILNRNFAFSTAIMALLLAIALCFSIIATNAISASAAIQSDYGSVYFESDSQTKEGILAQAAEVSEDITDEGIILLENENDSLPLDSSESVTFIGSAIDSTASKTSDGSVFLYDGGGSSSGVSNSSRDTVTLYEGLTASGLTVNTHVSYDTVYSKLASQDGDTTKLGDNAIVLISVEGSESVDQSTIRTTDDIAVALDYDGNTIYETDDVMDEDGVITEHNTLGHSMRLTVDELYNIIYATRYYENVIVMMNSCTQFEMGFIHDPASYFDAETGVMPMGASDSYAKEMTADDLTNIEANLNSALVVGYTGDSGATSIGSVLTGAVNPSGRTVSTWYNDFTLDPTFQNFGDNRGKGNDSLSDAGSYVHYDEDIYVGYRYYETNAYDLGTTDGEAWYQDNMVYPLGYGLSYTDFSYKIVGTSYENNAVLAKDGTIDVTVEVTNNGSTAGKEVVQLYYSSPYTKGGIEKAHVVLGAYEKTGMIAAKDTYTTTLSMKVEDMKSFDWQDLNENNIKGYELEAGDYQLYVSNDSHSWYNLDGGDKTATNALKLTYTVAEDIYYDVDSTTGNEVVALFGEGSDSESSTSDGGIEIYFSRSDFEGTFPRNGSVKASWGDQARLDRDTSEYEDSSKGWYVDEEDMPTYSEYTQDPDEVEVKLVHMMGRAYDDLLWDDLLDGLSLDEMAYLLGNGFGRTQAIESIDKPLTFDDDGPVGWTSHNYTPVDIGENTDYCFRYTSGTLVSQTYNKNLCYERGRMQGMEGALGNIFDEEEYYTYSGIYCPGANTHRSPFGGRNFEYFAEDPLVTGISSAYEIKGFNSMGVYTYYKHFFLNEQETDRNSLTQYVSEQAMREIYARGFEIGVKIGHPNAMMNTFGSVGRRGTPHSYEINTAMLRNEWGFEGFVMTDYGTGISMNEAIRTGLDVRLNNSESNYTSLLSADKTATQISCMRESTHRILYAVANSNAMNGHEATPLASISQAGYPMSIVAGETMDEDISGMATNRSETPYDYTLTSGILPDGVTLDETTGTLEGTPTTVGTYEFTITASERFLDTREVNYAGSGDYDYTDHYNDFLFRYEDVVSTYSVTVLDTAVAGVTFGDFTVDGTVLAGTDATINVGYAVRFDGNTATSEGITYALATDEEDLPDTMTFNADGTITGVTPDSTQTIVLSVVATYETYTDTAIVTIEIYEPTIEWTKVEIADGDLVVGTAYEVYFGDATGADNIYYTSTDLPEGLTLLRSNGRISGTPTAAYTDFTFTLSANAQGAETVDHVYTVNVYGIVTEDVVETVQLSKNYSFEVEGVLNDGTADADAAVIYAASSDVPDGVIVFASGKVVLNFNTTGEIKFTIIAQAYGKTSVNISITINVVDVDNNTN